MHTQTEPKKIFFYTLSLEGGNCETMQYNKVNIVLSKKKKYGPIVHSFKCRF